MEQEIVTRLREQEELLQKVYISTEKTRKYFMWTLVASIVLFVLPLMGLMFAVSAFLSTIGGVYGL